MSRMYALSLLLLLLLVSFQADQVLAGDIYLAAAESLNEVLTEALNGFTVKYPSVTVKRNFSGSGLLARQIENGEPADLFIPDSQQWQDYLKVRGFLDGRSIDVLSYSSQRIAYPLALTINGAKKSDAVACFRYLRSDEAKAIFVKHGFLVR